MTDLTRLLEYLATADKGELAITKYSRTSWVVRLGDLDDVVAIGAGSTLPQVAELCVADSVFRGLLEEPCPRTEPPPAPEEPAANPPCTHGIEFDEDAARGLDSAEVRKRWPRLAGVCPLGCGYSGIYYASFPHYVCGDW